MKCIFCGGKTVQQDVTFFYEHDDEYLFIQNVPAEVCLQCGEKTYSPEVTDDIINLVKQKMKAKRTIEVPVFDYTDQELNEV